MKKSLISSWCNSNISTARLLFYSLWFVLGIIQASTTDLIYDECYYWVCSNHIDWGHFYYPPFIDILIQAGYTLFENPLGVRLMFILLSTGGIFLLERLLVKEERLIFYSIMLSLIPLQVAGILAAPDIPLFFFTITFYILFRRFLERTNTLTLILLSINTALLLYIKYHGILVIGFSFLFNIKELYRRRDSYYWIAISIILFLPHIWWQIENGFPTVNFHLFNRPEQAFLHPKNLLDYIPGQLLFAGPIAAPLLFYSLTKLKTESRFERTLLLNLIAMYIFFGLFSLKNHIEINWTVIGMPALIVLSHKVLCERDKLSKILYKTLPYSIGAMVIVRILLIFPTATPIKRLNVEVSGHQEWANTIQTLADGRPVVFSDKYQKTSVYYFYSKDSLVYTLNPGQPSDFEMFGYEEKLQGEDIFAISKHRLRNNIDSIETKKGRFYYLTVNNFRSYKRTEISSKAIAIDKSRDRATTTLTLGHDYNSNITYTENPELPSTIGCKIYRGSDEVADIANIIEAKELLKQPKEIAIDLLKIDGYSREQAAEYQLQFYIKTGFFIPIRCSRLLKLKV